MILYVVEMLRWGERDNHSYVIGVFDTHEAAEHAGEVHKVWRGQKYEYSITRHELNSGPTHEELKYYEQCTKVDRVLYNFISSNTDEPQT